MFSREQKHMELHGPSCMRIHVRTCLEDGHGKFEESRPSIMRDITAPMPMKTTEFGEFHVTNLNGSSYPSLSYVYRAKFSRSYVCVTVDGRSDGQLSNAMSHEIGISTPGANGQLTAADLNGNGMDDWLFWTLDGGIPTLAPVYNHAKVVDFLLSAKDPMWL